MAQEELKTSMSKLDTHDDSPEHRQSSTRGTDRIELRGVIEVKLTGYQIKKIIMEESIRLNLFHIVVAGLPLSGKSTLVNTLFGTPGSEKMPDKELHKSMILRNKSSDTSYWTDAPKVNTEIHTILNAFAHFFINERLLPKLELDSSDLKVFDDAEVQGYFKTTYENLRQLLLDSEQVNNIYCSSLTLVNIFDFGMNKAVMEFMMAIHGRNRKMLLLDVINMKEYSTKKELLDPLSLENLPYTEESQVSIYEGRSAMHHLLLPVEAAALSSSIIAKEESISQSQAPRKVLFIGTHADILGKPLSESKSTLLNTINDYCREMGYQSVSSILGDVITVNATDVNDCEKIKKKLLKLIDANKSFSIDLPVKFIFLRYILQLHKEVFMSREKVVDYARKCGIDGDEEISRFFQVFRDCAAIISSDQSEDFLYHHVILRLTDFLRDLNKLYCIKDNKSLLPEHKTTAKYGIVDKAVVRALWQGSDNNSMPTYEFYVRALMTVGLLMELPSGKYFVPSLRSIHNGSNSDHPRYIPIRPDSLIIRCGTGVTLTPFSSKQCHFVKYLLKRRSDDFQLVEDCDFYNCIEFLWGNNAKVTIRFFHDLIEVHVDTTEISQSDAYLLYSTLKTDCVIIMNEISSSFHYEFCLVCPNSDPKPHFVPFDIPNSSSEEFECKECRCEGCKTMGYKSKECNIKMCREKIQSHEVKGIHWVRAAYQGPQRSAVPSTDVLDPKNLLAISEKLSSLTIQDIRDKLAKGLDITHILSSRARGSHVPVKEVLFDCLYTWHSKNLSATKKDLAALLDKCGLYKEAIALDPQLYRKPPTTTTFTNKEIAILAKSWSCKWEELGEVLQVLTNTKAIAEKLSDEDKCTYILQEWLKAQKPGDTRETLAELFQEEYPSMTTAIYDL